MTTETQCTAEGRSNVCTTRHVPRICEQNKSLSKREKVYPTSFIAHIFLNGTITFQNDQRDMAKYIFLKEIFLHHLLKFTTKLCVSVLTLY